MGALDFATRSEEFRPSPVRAVFETAMDPKMVSLAGGDPDLTALPTQEIADITRDLLASRGQDVLQYGSGAGRPNLRATVAGMMAARGVEVSDEEIQPLAGSQSGIDLVTKLYCNPGDVIIAEGPTFVGALGTFGSYEVEVRQVEVDDDGLNPQDVAAAIDQARAEGRRVPFVYVIPNFQNPTGVTLSTERRRELVEVCAQREVMIIEDDPYGLLGFDRSAAPLPTLVGMDRENVIHLGSASKIFSPGLRVGWAIAPAAVRARMQIAAEAVLIHPSNLSQELVASWVGSPDWPAVLDRSCALYESRRNAAMEALQKHLGGVAQWTEPTGGFFTWVRFPDRDLDNILMRAIDAGVVIVPGDACYTDGRASDAIRIAYSGVDEERIEEGVRRLATVFA